MGRIKFTNWKNCVAFCFLIFFFSCQQPLERDSISLAGEWSFRMDPDDQGLTDQWYRETFEQTVLLPGSMTENGMGKEVTLETEWTGNIVDRSYFTDAKYEKYRQAGNLKIPFWLKPVKYYSGPAWYQREFALPGQWKGKRVILSLERCHWESQVFVNNVKLGTSNSLAVAHEYDITSAVKEGDNTVCIRIDNRMILPVGVNSHSVSDHTQSNWNGIIGDISLEARSKLSIKNIQLYPDIHKKNVRVRLELINGSGNHFEGSVELEAREKNPENTQSPEPKTLQVSIPAGEKVIELEYKMGEWMKPWSEFSPELYHMKVSLSDSRGTVLDSRSEVFGMREFKTEGTRFLVNGRAVFLRGTLECCIFPLTGYPPMDTESWLYVMKRCKDHGLNHIRFHSWCPPEAAFDAADQMGVYLQVECGSWANQGSAVGSGNPLDQFIYDESERIIRAFGNHPSFCMLAYGNEPAGENMSSYLVDLMDHWRSMDNRRVYTSGAGWPLLPENDFHNGPQPRIQQWGQGLGSVINAEAPQTMFDFREIISKYKIPFVGHEIGQWCVYPDFKEIPKYTGVLKPTNFEIFQETLEEHHMGEQADDFLMASGKLQALCYKAEIEAALRTPGFAGFQLLQLHDFPGQGTALVGILDPFFNSKGYISGEEFSLFCNETVPLARLKKRVFTNQETFSADIELSHFGSAALKDAVMTCIIKDIDGTVLHKQQFSKNQVPLDNAIYMGSISYQLKGINTASKMILTATLEGTAFKNSWEFWVYPEDADPDPGQVHISNRLDKESMEFLNKGGSVLLLAHGKIGPAAGGDVEIGFSSIFWNTAWTRGQAPHTLGILCDPNHPLFSGYPTEYHSNWQWWDPITNSQAMILDQMPPGLKPLIQPIDTWFENRKLGLAFEARVGAGKILVCSIDMQKSLNQRPASKQLFISMLDYMNSSEFIPGVEIEAERILDLLQDYSQAFR